eukprot:g12402.t1
MNMIMGVVFGGLVFGSHLYSGVGVWEPHCVRHENTDYLGYNLLETNNGILQGMRSYVGCLQWCAEREACAGVSFKAVPAAATGPARDNCIPKALTVEGNKDEGDSALIYESVVMNPRCRLALNGGGHVLGQPDANPDNTTILSSSETTDRGPRTVLVDGDALATKSKGYYYPDYKREPKYGSRCQWVQLDLGAVMQTKSRL